MRNRTVLVMVAALSSVLIAAPLAHAAPPDFAPCCLSATSISTHEIDIAWVPIGTPVPGTTGYRIERETGIGTGFTVIVANTGSTATTYNDTNLAPGSTYDYRVSTINADGMSSPSNPVSATTASLTNISTSDKPTGFVAQAASGSEIDLSWTAPQLSVSILGYRIERENGIGNGFMLLTANTSSTATTYSDIGLAPGATYNYRITVLTPFGAGTNSATAYATTLRPPGQPQNAKAVGGDGKITVSWTPAVGATSTQYLVFDLLGGVSTTVDGGVTTTVITGLVNGSTYYLSVIPSNAAGNGIAAILNPVTPLPLPSAPTSTTPSPTIAPTSTITPLPPVAPTKYVFTYLLYVGTRGQAVTELQKRLTSEGVYHGPVTGYFGSLTQAGVKAYQALHGVRTTGMVGILTRAQLNGN